MTDTPAQENRRKKWTAPRVILGEMFDHGSDAQRTPGASTPDWTLDPSRPDTAGARRD